jgi:N-formylglutamate deformylase
VNLSNPTLAAFESGPVRILRPKEWCQPFIFASPHSGRTYPSAFVAASALSALALRRSEDAFVDELFAAAPQFGSPLLAAEFPRAFVDANRAPGELDVSMFDKPLTVPVEPPSPRVQAGLGVIPRVVRDGVEIYRRKLPAADAEWRLARLYRPYHTALAKLVEESWLRFGCAVVIDCHSMPSMPSVPEIVFGDCHGMSAPAALIRHVERAFGAQGFASTRNAPYAGGFTTHLYARSDRGIHALQIEINRSLYLDEERIEKTPRFAAVKGRLTTALRTVLDFDWRALRQRSQAAE